MSENTRERVYPLPFVGYDRTKMKAALAPRLKDQFGIEEFGITDWSIDLAGRHKHLLRPEDIKRGMRIVEVTVRYPHLSP